MAVIVAHGGAGSGGYGAKGKKALREAISKGAMAIENGAIDAVDAVISSMEDTGIFDAGKGSYLQLDGKVRMDASVMTSGLKAGAVAGIESVRNPIKAARKVMELTDHVMLIGRHATDFALNAGLKKGKLGTAKAVSFWKKLKNQTRGLGFNERLRKLHQLRMERYYSTVGCVALDDSGVLCAGTSTGGLGIMLPGRVGDTPLIGCGTYCSPAAACSATGVGEDIIRAALARKAVDFVDQRLYPSQAARKAIKKFDKELRSKAGLILLDKKGRYGAAYNTKAMMWEARKA